jgi:hypothetical protein
MILEGKRTHRNIDKLPKDLINIIISMAVDNIWPEDFKGEKTGHPRYEDMASYVQQKGRSISVYAIGRFCRRLRSLTVMKNSAMLIKDAMKLTGKVKASETQKAVAEMISCMIIEHISGQDELEAKDISSLARAARDCTQVAIAADKYMRGQIQENIASASKQIGVIAKKKNIDPMTLKAIREQIYGILDEHLGYQQK